MLEVRFPAGKYPEPDGDQEGSRSARIRKGKKVHELGVTESIAGIVLRHANMNGARRVLKVNIKLGELTGIVDHYVSFYWDLVTKDTIAQGAELNFIKVPTVAWCSRCREEFHIEEYDLTCPGCGELASELVSGKEFMVESIEIE